MRRETQSNRAWSDNVQRLPETGLESDDTLFREIFVDDPDDEGNGDDIELEWVDDRDRRHKRSPRLRSRSLRMRLPDEE